MVSDMNNIYFISKDNRFRLTDDFEPVEDGNYSAGFDEAISQDLDDPDRIKRVELRCHKRFHLREDAFALIRSISAGPLKIKDKSMGCIACAVFNAKPARLGKIENISMGGLMFQHIAGKTQLNKSFVLDILLADCRFYLANMPFEIKADVVLPDDIPDDPIEMRQVRLGFQKLSTNHQAMLKDLILNHGTQISEIGVKD